MSDKPLSSHAFPDQNQNFWQLASIQLASFGLPGFFAGTSVADKFGPGAAITSIIIGNLITWIIALVIISMAAKNRDNAMENTQRYLGKTGGIVAATCLIVGFLTWYILQLNSAVSAIQAILKLDGGHLRLGAGLGLAVALLSIGGIQIIKMFSVYAFPIMAALLLYSGALFGSSSMSLDWNFSFLGVVIILAGSLPGIVNLPTFFRHSRSLSDSFLGLILMIVFSMLFQIYPVIVGFSGPDHLQDLGTVNVFLVLLFVLLALFAVNLVNIYFASAGWEMILPHRRSSKEYAIVGLLGTMAYTFLQISSPMLFLLDMTDNFLVSLGVILLIAYLVRIFVRDRPRKFEKMIYLSCWLFGGTVGTIVQARGERDPTGALIFSVCASILAFLVVFFVEEAIWSVQNVMRRRNDG